MIFEGSLHFTSQFTSQNSEGWLLGHDHRGSLLWAGLMSNRRTELYSSVILFYKSTSEGSPWISEQSLARSNNFSAQPCKHTTGLRRCFAISGASKYFVALDTQLGGLRHNLHCGGPLLLTRSPTFAQVLLGVVVNLANVWEKVY